MRSRIAQQWHLVVACSTIVTACNPDSLVDVQTSDPRLKTVPVSSIFTAATVDAAGLFLGPDYVLHATGLFAQHFAQVQYTEEDRYLRLSASTTSDFFSRPYTGPLINYRVVADTGRARNAPGIWAPATIMQAWVLSYVTDTFGDVPYSEALKGDLGSTAVRTPRYDAQRDIYLGLIESLTRASTALSGNPAPTLGAGDVIFGGDPAAWQRFANSLRARLALRMMNADATAASAALRGALEAPGGLFRSNADNAVLRYPGDETGANPWATALQYDFWRMSRTLMDPMVATNDPRIPAFAMPTQADPTVYAGMPNGLSNAAASAWLLKSSRPGEVFLPTNTPYGDFSEATGRARPAVLMTFAEVEFIRAEAAARGIAGLTPGQAEALYTAGITASIRQWTDASAAGIAAFLAQPEIAYKSGTDGLNQIARQRWIAVFPDGGQAWAEWRRTCQPSTVVAGPNASLTYVPRRLRYSSLEAAANGANLRAAIARQGPDEPSTRVWWDSKPEAAPTCR